MKILIALILLSTFASAREMKIYQGRAVYLVGHLPVAAAGGGGAQATKSEDAPVPTKAAATSHRRMFSFSDSTPAK